MEPATVQILAWIILALTCFALEMFTGTLVVVWFGVGALAAAGTVPLLPSTELWWIPWLVWATASVGLVLASRKFANRLGLGGTILANSDALVGKKGYVESEINPVKGAGRVLIGGEDWKASSDRVIPAGVSVRIIEVKGAHLLVKPEEQEEGD